MLEAKLAEKDILIKNQAEEIVRLQSLLEEDGKIPRKEKKPKRKKKEKHLPRNEITIESEIEKIINEENLSEREIKEENVKERKLDEENIMEKKFNQKSEENVIVKYGSNKDKSKLFKKKFFLVFLVNFLKKKFRKMMKKKSQINKEEGKFF